MDLEDNYEHENEYLEYCLENILFTPKIETIEYVNLKNIYNSILTNNCLCTTLCFDECSHSQNYKIFGNINGKELILNENRLSKDLIYECSKNCKCLVECGNRLVQFGPRKNLLVMSSKLIPQQKGLFTTEKIPKGAFICEYAGEIITKTEAKQREIKLESIRSSKDVDKLNILNYIMCLREKPISDKNGEIIETFVDPTKIGNIGRYINHSCDPNCEVLSVRVDCPIPKIAIFATCDIGVMNELFFHYGGGINKKNYSGDMIECLCNSVNCQKMLPKLKF